MNMRVPDFLVACSQAITCASRTGAAKVAGYIAVVYSMTLHIGLLWEAIAKDESIWGDLGSIYLGVLPGPRGRCRRIAGGLKRAIQVEVQNGTGRGVRNAKTLVRGMHLAAKRGPSQKVRDRKARHISASSQKSGSQSHGFSEASARGFPNFEMWNYHLESRRPIGFRQCVRNRASE